MTGVATTQAALVDLTMFKVDILLALARDGPQSGSEVKRVLEERYDGVNHGALYPNLDSLAQTGLVEKRRHEPDNRTNEYELTETGRDAIETYAHYVTTYLSGEVTEGLLSDGGER